ncbi:hypothetical protein BJ912DRAFT_1001440 [Pholiota molesta]|nr:hypothetical protein BJ912DRAFT_1001440 [Pholiota molesta]
MSVPTLAMARPTPPVISRPTTTLNVAARPARGGRIASTNQTVCQRQGQAKAVRHEQPGASLWTRALLQRSLRDVKPTRPHSPHTARHQASSKQQHRALARGQRAHAVGRQRGGDAADERAGEEVRETRTEGEAISWPWSSYMKNSSVRTSSAQSQIVSLAARPVSLIDGVRGVAIECGRQA